MTIQKWGGVSSFLLAVVFIVAPFIYLTGDLNNALGPFAYSLADLLYGPIWGANLITSITALRERIGDHAPRRMAWTLSAALFAAGMMILVACIRSANRQYHLTHPELHLEGSMVVLSVWATLVAGVTGAGWHFLGWTLILLGWSGFTSGRLPRGLCILYLFGGAASLFVYVSPVLEGAATMLGLLWAIWQGVLLWRGEA